jgi:RNA binding exosome subunit
LDNPILPYNELSEIFTELFIEYTEEANFSLKTLWELFNLTFNKTGVISETQNEGYYPNKAKKALKSSLNKDNIEEFLEISKGVSSHNNAGLIKYQIFDNYTELYDFVNQFPETPFLKQFLKTIKDKKDGEV